MSFASMFIEGAKSSPGSEMLSANSKSMLICRLQGVLFSLTWTGTVGTGHVATQLFERTSLN